MKTGKLMLVGYLWILLLGCGLFRREAEPDPPPAVDYEGCSNDHTTQWIAADNAELRSGVTPADQECNELVFYNGGGFQGGNVFHFEPTLHLTTTPESTPLDITYEISTMDGRVIGTQGFELFADPATEPRTDDYSHQLFLEADDRGKNVIVRALITFEGPNGRSDVEVKAAFYLGGPA